jgi:hypothetical protein
MSPSTATPQALRPALLLAVLALAAGACRPNIPMPEVKVSADEASRARGEYLAHHGMGCVVCHSQRDWSRFSGPVAAGTELVGSNDIAREDGFPESFSFGAANLTPYFLKDWSDGEIARAIALGQSKDGHGLFPLMPYPEYREHLAVDDLAALVSYLRALPQKAHDVPPRKFPMPGFVLDGMPVPRTLRDKAPKPGSPDYPAYVTGVAGCLACHTGADDRGQLIGAPYAGGRDFKIPAPGAGIVRSANLTPDETGLGAWTREMFIGRFKAATLEAARAQATEPGGYNTVMPWWAYAGMTEEDLGAIYDFLRALPPVKNKVAKTTAKLPQPGSDHSLPADQPVEAEPDPQ